MIGWPQFPVITNLKNETFWLVVDLCTATQFKFKNETFWLVVELCTAKQLIGSEVKEFWQIWN
jgi:hypothetical protein